MMKEPVLDEVMARKFLLGQLSPEEQGQIEELAFEDPRTFTFLESVEDDLIDDFIHDELSQQEKQRFKDHFLSLPGRRQNLKISRVLQQHFDETETQQEIVDDQKFSFFAWVNQRPWLRLSITAAVLALVLIAVWLFLRAKQAEQPAPMQAGPDKPVTIPSPELKVSPSLEPTRSPVHVENKPKSPSPEKQTTVPIYATLFPAASPRGEGSQELELPSTPNASSVPLRLILDTRRNFGTYQVALENEAGTVLDRRTNLKAKRFQSGRVLEIEVPSALLKPQNFYRIVVSIVPTTGETEEIAGYPFEVVN